VLKTWSQDNELIQLITIIIITRLLLILTKLLYNFIISVYMLYNIDIFCWGGGGTLFKMLVGIGNQYSIQYSI